MSLTLNVHIRVNDAETGQPTPVRIRFADASGKYYPPLGRPAEFPLGRNEDVGGHVYLNGKRYAYIDGACEVPLPTGQPLEVEVSKGPAYEPIRQTITLGEGQISLRFAIRRWIAESWQGYLAADTRSHFLAPHSAKLEAAAEGLDLVNLLALVQDYPSQDGRLYRSIPNMTAFSGQSPAFERVYVNTFNLHPVLGRLGLLNSHRAVFPLTFGQIDETDDWSLSDWCDQCHRKKGLVVWCDAYRSEAGLPGGEALVNAVLGKIDAVELDAHARATPFLVFWYRLLNAGIRLPLVGGSAKDSNRIALGALRTLAPAADYLNWVEQVRAGRAIATNGPYLAMSIDGQLLPTRVDQPEIRPLQIVAEAAALEAFDKLEVIANGEVVASSEGPSARLEVEHTLPSGGWVAARCWGAAKSSAFAHTSPCFVETAGAPAFRRLSAVDATLREIAAVRSWVETEGRFTNPRRREFLLSQCDAAGIKLSASP